MRVRLPRHSQSIAVGLLLALLALALAAGTLRGPSHLAQVKSRGRLVMLCFPTYAGSFSRPNLERGPTRRVGGPLDFGGIDIEIGTALARHLGVELEIHTLETPGYGPLIPALLKGEADLIISTISITEQRKELVDFSDPYFSSYSLVVARKDARITSPATLAGKKAVAIPGSSHEEYLLELGLQRSQLVPVQFTSEYLTTLDEGGADIAVVDSNSTTLDLSQFPGLTVAFHLPKDDHYGIAMPKGSDLLPEVNDFLSAFRKSGELDEVFRRNPYY